VADGAQEQRDPHALAAYLLHVTLAEIPPAEPFEAEFKALATGAKSIRRTDCWSSHHQGSVQVGRW
jgi:hypothetical protein